LSIEAACCPYTSTRIAIGSIAGIEQKRAIEIIPGPGFSLDAMSLDIGAVSAR
jgi:hypothetical protein